MRHESTWSTRHERHESTWGTIADSYILLFYYCFFKVVVASAAANFFLLFIFATFFAFIVVIATVTAKTMKMFSIFLDAFFMLNFIIFTICWIKICFLRFFIFNFLSVCCCCCCFDQKTLCSSAIFRYSYLVVLITLSNWFNCLFFYQLYFVVLASLFLDLL